MRSRLLRTSDPLRTFAAWLALFAVLQHGIFAPGLMPDLDAAARGELKLVICSAAGAKPLDSEPAPDSPGDRDPAKQPCDYAAFGHTVLTADPLPSAPASLSPHAEPELYERIQPAARPAANGARAPPTAWG